MGGVNAVAKCKGGSGLVFGAVVSLENLSVQFFAIGVDCEKGMSPMGII